MNVFDILILAVIAVCLWLALRGRKKANERGEGCCSACSGTCYRCGMTKDNK